MNKIIKSVLILFLNAHNRTKDYVEIWNFHQIFILVYLEHEIIFKIF